MIIQYPVVNLIHKLTVDLSLALLIAPLIGPPAESGADPLNPRGRAINIQEQNVIHTSYIKTESHHMDIEKLHTAECLRSKNSLHVPSLA